MSSFTRLAGVAVLLLSLGFLVSALPAPKTDDIHIAITGGGDPVTAALVNLVVNLDVEAKIRALGTFLPRPAKDSSNIQFSGL